MTVTEYIAQFDGETRRRIEAMRQVILESAPSADELITPGTHELRGNRSFYSVRKINKFFH